MRPHSAFSAALKAHTEMFTPRTQMMVSSRFTRSPSGNHIRPLRRLASSLHSPAPNPHKAYYQTHGRALFKCLTLAFLTYQTVYWSWLKLDAEEKKHFKELEIRSLENEVRDALGRKGKGEKL